MHGEEGRAVGYSRYMKKRRITISEIGNGGECIEDIWLIQSAMRQLKSMTWTCREVECECITKCWEDLYLTPRPKPLLSETAPFQTIPARAQHLPSPQRNPERQETVPDFISESGLKSKVPGDDSEEGEADHRIMSKRNIDKREARNLRRRGRTERTRTRSRPPSTSSTIG